MNASLNVIFVQLKKHSAFYKYFVHKHGEHCCEPLPSVSILLHGKPIRAGREAIGAFPPLSQPHYPKHLAFS